MNNKIENLLWQIMGGVGAVFSLAIISWVGDFNYPDERGGTALFIMLVYVLWFIAGVRFMKHIRGGK